MTLKVAYQGIPGAYSEGAAVEYFGEEAVLIPCSTFDLVFEKLLSRGDELDGGCEGVLESLIRSLVRLGGSTSGSGLVEESFISI
mmetsp:Transcript_30300/g.116200  ORF Transcript_30300/g.116200 Transcript_30300/m.116200 type:complete len:85 (-) Transcript_30300:133-387(-)